MPKKPKMPRLPTPQKPKITIGPGGINYATLVRNLFDSKNPLILIIRGYVEIESLLSNLIAKWLLHPEGLQGNRLGFPDKLKLAVALGAVKPAETVLFTAFAKLRNDFAHHKRSQFTKNNYDQITANMTGDQHRILRAFPRPLNNLERLSYLVYLMLLQLEYSARYRDRAKKFIMKKSIQKEIRTWFPLLLADKAKRPFIDPQIRL